MGEKVKVFSDCEICGKNYWLKDLVKAKRQAWEYNYTGKLDEKLKRKVQSRTTCICKACVEAMDKGKGAESQLVGSDIPLLE